MEKKIGMICLLVLLTLAFVLSGCTTGEATGVCGNGVCDLGENAAKCPIDCETDPCKNTICESGEDCYSCPTDCPKEVRPLGGTCSACFKGECDGVCKAKKEGPDCADCAPVEVIACCGDAVCEGSETESSCAIDCEVPSTT